MIWSPNDIKRTTESRRAYFISHLKTGGEAVADAKREHREAYSECRYCFYFGHGIAGQAFTDYKCAMCGKTESHENTAVPKLCPSCSKIHELCRRCGGEREWGAATTDESMATNALIVAAREIRRELDYEMQHVGHAPSCPGIKAKSACSCGWVDRKRRVAAFDKAYKAYLDAGGLL